MRRASPVVILACGVLAAGCGDSRAPVPNLTHPAPPGGFRTLRFPSAGVSFSSPRSWPSVPQRSPLVTVIASGSAVISLWRYARPAAAPSSGSLLAAARATLVGAIRSRQPTARVLRSRLTRIGGAPAIEFEAVERVGGGTRQVLSTHVFAPRSEVVLEEYAPPALFTSLRHTVFARVRRSLALLAAAR